MRVSKNVCVYIYIYICVYLFVYVNNYWCIQRHTYACICVCTCACIYGIWCRDPFTCIMSSSFFGCWAGAAMLHNGCLNYGIRSVAVDASRLSYVDNIPNMRVGLSHSVEPLEQFCFYLPDMDLIPEFLRWNITRGWMFHLQWALWLSFNLSGA